MAECPKTCPLSKLNVGCQGQVISVAGEPDVRRRLLEMGFCNGATVEVIRRAPMGDPIEFRLRGYHLSLRHEQANCVTILSAGAAAVEGSGPERNRTV